MDERRTVGGAALGRRRFLGRVGGAAAGLLVVSSRARRAWAQTDPIAARVLGRTGQKVSILGLGTAPVGEGPVGVEEGIRIFGEALDRGATYVDTARIYGNAEEILGHLVPSRRARLFLATKVSTNAAADAERSLETSLRHLKTDYLDLVHIHSVGSRDIDRVLGKDGVLEYLLAQKEKGRIRFVGITGHSRSGNFVRLLETGRIDVVMCIMNYADRSIYRFEETVLPVARARNIGCAAMKVYAGIKGGFPNHRRGHVGCVTEPERMPAALAYALDLEGVSVAVVGPYTQEHSIRNAAMAAKYRPLTGADRTDLLEHGARLAPSLGPRYGPVS